MNGPIKAAVTASLLGTLIAGIASAGETAAPPPAGAPPQRQAFVNAFFDRMDTNKDGQVTRLEAELASKSLFAKMDANGDGEITKAEAEASANAQRRAELGAHLQAADANHDGRLTAEEAKLPPALFQRLDANADHALTLEELQAMPGPAAAHRAEFDRSDANHDGKVTRDEGNRSSQERFALIDTNKDNLITRPELEARMDAMLKSAAKTAAPAAPPH